MTGTMPAPPVAGGRVRVVIVDDEPLAREGLRTIVCALPDVEVVGECADGERAVERLLQGGVDIVLLDVQLPDMDGFAVLRRVPEALMPVVVFVTAHDHHALEAFEASAIDYVVKPFRDARIRAALTRASRQVAQRRAGDAYAVVAELLTHVGRGDAGAGAAAAAGAHTVPAHEAQTSPMRRPVDRIAVRSVGRVSYVRVADVVWIGAADYYAELHTRDGRTHLVRETMQRLEERLDPARFARTHRTAIVCLDQVAELRTLDGDRAVVVLRDGTRVPLGRNRREMLEARLAAR
jgi:two-component system LytT family response regulator